MMLFTIKFIHTIIFLIMSAAILYVFYGGMTDNYHPTLLLIALVMVAVESAVFIGNGRRCPLTKLAQEHGDTGGGHDFIADIFLPDWMATKIPPVCGALFVIGLIALLIHLVL
jgi:hypothetical protein